MEFNYKQINGLIDEIYLDAADDYQMNPDAFERRYIEYDILRQLLFVRYSPNGKIFYTKMNKSAKKILPYVDLSEVNFCGIQVDYTDFSNTNADINPQTVFDKNVRGCNFCGLDMSKYSFDGCDVRFAKFDNKGIYNINPKKVTGYDEIVFLESDVKKK